MEISFTSLKDKSAYYSGKTQQDLIDIRNERLSSIVSDLRGKHSHLLEPRKIANPSMKKSSIDVSEYVKLSENYKNKSQEDLINDLNEKMMLGVSEIRNKYSHLLSDN